MPSLRRLPVIGAAQGWQPLKMIRPPGELCAPLCFFILPISFSYILAQEFYRCSFLLLFLTWIKAPVRWLFTSAEAAVSRPTLLPARRFFKTKDGTKVQVLSEGSGPEAQPGDRVLIDYVLRRRYGPWLGQIHYQISAPSAEWRQGG